MKKVYLFLALLPLVFGSCSSSSDDDSLPEVPQKEYKVQFVNAIDKSQVSKMSDGVLYDVHLVSQDGNVYAVGDLQNMTKKDYTLPKGYDNTKVLFMILKIGKNASEAKTKEYWTPEFSYGKIEPIFASEKGFVMTINENTTYSSFPYTNIDDFKKYVKSIVDNLVF